VTDITSVPLEDQNIITTIKNYEEIQEKCYSPFRRKEKLEKSQNRREEACNKLGNCSLGGKKERGHVKIIPSKV